MKTPSITLRLALTVLVGAVSLTGCWYSSSSYTTLTLAVADTPVDGAQSVTLTFTGVQIQPAGGAMIEQDYSTPRQVDILQLQDDSFALLLNNLGVSAGSYLWVRPLVDMSRSSITLSDGSVHPLVLTNAAQDPFKITSGFTVASDEQAAFVIDFDLRRSISLVAGNYDFTPYMRFLDANQTSEIEGVVSNTLTIGGVAISDPACQPAAYVYPGNVTPVDINPTSSVQPLQTANVMLDNFSGNYHYGVQYLSPGAYTVALVCAAGDDPTTSDALTFTTPKSATVAADKFTEVDFP
ncbi:MAG TPA: DUF4382 domain-containing protein [Gammaproteobacteria bacterium]|nr:DUF4382 domain-containing protein [Gammaproteobacteria bacterium]